LFRRGITFNAFEELIVKSEVPVVSGPLAGMTRSEIEHLFYRLQDRNLIETSLSASGQVQHWIQPVIRDYFLQALPDRGPFHKNVAERLIQLLESKDRILSRHAADVVLEIVYQLTQSKHMSPAQIARLATLLPRDGDAAPTELAATC
jgi:hypothetical protein